MSFSTAIVGLVCWLASSTAVLAQMADFKLSKADDKSFVVAVPLVIVGSEAGLHLEANLWNEAAIAIEYLNAPRTEEYSDKQMEEDNVSLESQAWEVAALLSRYSNPESMGGFYWTLGAGYRSTSVIWRKEPQNMFGLRGTEVFDDSGRLNHELQGTGMTGHGRLGYRYVPETWPVSVGGFFGFRHYEARFKDSEESSANAEVVSTSDQDKQQLRRANMTKPELALEVGMIF
jgi:hypothetical protein